MPQYLLSVWFDDDYSDELERTDPDIIRTSAQIDALHEEMTERGVWVFVGGLQPASSATVVRSNAGETSMTEAPASVALFKSIVLHACPAGQATNPGRFPMPHSCSYAPVLMLAPLSST